MSTTTNTAAALHVVNQYNDAGKALIGAYRAGASRLLGTGASRYSAFLDGRRIPMVSDEAKARLLNAQAKVTSFLENRLDVDTGRVIALMDRVANGATSGIESLANATARVETQFGGSVINTVGRAYQPIADISVKLADTVAAGAKKLESRATDNGVNAKVVKAVKTVKAEKVAEVKSAVSRAKRAVRKA